jgi:hypothetical protein
MRVQGIVRLFGILFLGRCGVADPMDFLAAPKLVAA